MERLLRKKLRGGVFGDVSAARSTIMRAVKSRGNRTTEKRLRAGLIRAGIAGWQVHCKGIIGNPDFYFAARKLAVFVDGCFWHGCPKCGHIPKNNQAFWRTKINRNSLRDITMTRRIEKEGITVLRFWEHQLKEDLANCVSDIQRYPKLHS